jgi:hypothetical protein
MLIVSHLSVGWPLDENSVWECKREETIRGGGRAARERGGPPRTGVGGDGRLRPRQHALDSSAPYEPKAAGQASAIFVPQVPQKVTVQCAIARRV